jgi:hypothetical protein
MSIPGLAWLTDRLNTTDQVSGGYRSEIGNPVAAGAGFGVRAVFILALLLALLPLCLWSLGRWAWNRRRDG